MSAAKTPNNRDNFFGRRKGRTLRRQQSAQRHDVLPGLLLQTDQPIADVSDLFAQPVDRYCLEIGFGGGEHMVHRLQRNPADAFIGIEPFINGMAKGLAAAVLADVTDRLRLVDVDGAILLDCLPQGSIDLVYLLYPDPWPKRRHWKRRFVNTENVDRLARVIKPGGSLFVASDITHYIDWTLMHLQRHPDFVWSAVKSDDWQEPFADWPSTRYEQKARREGRSSAYLQFRRR